MSLDHAAVPLANQHSMVPEWIILKGQILSRRVLALPSLADLKHCIASTGAHAQVVTVQVLKTLIDHASESIHSMNVDDIERYFKAMQLVLAASDSIAPRPVAHVQDGQQTKQSYISFDSMTTLEGPALSAQLLSTTEHEVTTPKSPSTGAATAPSSDREWYSPITESFPDVENAFKTSLRRYSSVSGQQIQNDATSPQLEWLSLNDQESSREGNDQSLNMRALVRSPIFDEEFSLQIWSSSPELSPVSENQSLSENGYEPSQGSLASSPLAAALKWPLVPNTQSQASLRSDESNSLSLGADSAYQTTEETENVIMSISSSGDQFCSTDGWRSISTVYAPKPERAWSKPSFLAALQPMRVSMDVFNTLSDATDSLIYTTIFPVICKPDTENIQTISRALLNKVLESGNLGLPKSLLMTIAQDWHNASVISPQGGMEWISFLAADLAANLEHELSSLSSQDEDLWNSRLSTIIMFIVEVQTIPDIAFTIAASLIASLENLFACASLLPGKSEVALSRIGQIMDVICSILTSTVVNALSTHAVTILKAWLEFIYQQAEELVGCFLRDQMHREMLLLLAELLTHVYPADKLKLVQRPNFQSLIAFVFDKQPTSIKYTLPYKKASAVLLLLACFPELGLVGGLPLGVVSVDFHNNGGVISPYIDWLEYEMSVARGHRANTNFQDALAVLMEAQTIEETVQWHMHELRRS